VNSLLNELEVRILGCLMEKELTTPEQYPLTLNALTNACNQKSNRDPVMTLDEDDVVRGLNSLKFKQLVVVSSDGGRVPKYRHILAERQGLAPEELAPLCELLVRGPQTGGELRTRTERMRSFPDLAAVEEVLAELMKREPPLVTRLARQPGRKEARYAHLFAGEPVVMSDEGTSPPEAARLRVMAGDERMARLEEEVAHLKSEVTELRQMVAEFKSQFE
jgi:uncharacterized protein